MPRERAKLSDKQERILVQAQLMGLTARDMQQIGNRLIALQQEAQEKFEIAETIQGYTWETFGKDGWKITMPDGYVIQADRGIKLKSRWDSYQWDFDITVTKPGTRFKPRRFKNKGIHIPYEWKKKLMPENNKELYGLIRWTKNLKWELGQ